MNAVVVIGPPGSGKTSVLTALHDVLADSGIVHAALEVEALAWTHPPLPDETSFQHLTAMCRMYDKAARQLVLVGATATSADYLAAVLTAIEADDHLVVRLDARPATLRERIIEREPPEWSGLPALLAAVEELATATRSIENVDVVCSTEDVSPFAVAAQIRNARPDLLGESAPRPVRPERM